MKIVVFDVWRNNDRAEFSVCVRALQRRGFDVLDLYLPPQEFASMDQWCAALMGRLSQEVDLAHESVALLGFCAGGRVALEIATLLRATKSSAAFVGLIETWIRSPITELNRDLYRRYRVRPNVWVRQQLIWAAITPGGTFGQLLKAQFDSIVARIRRGSVGSQPATVPDLEWTLMNFTHNRMVRVMDEHIHLFNTGDSIVEQSNDSSLGLAPYLRAGFTVHRLAGEHHTCTKLPHQDGLLDAVVKALGTVES